MEPSAFAYAERHDNIESIYKKLEERRDTADVTDLLMKPSAPPIRARRSRTASASI